MKPQKSKSKQRGFDPALLSKDDLTAARQRPCLPAGRSDNMVFWSEPTLGCMGLQAGHNVAVVAIARREG